jgi:hypothetical protein
VGSDPLLSKHSHKIIIAAFDKAVDVQPSALSSTMVSTDAVAAAVRRVTRVICGCCALKCGTFLNRFFVAILQLFRALFVVGVVS